MATPKKRNEKIEAVPTDVLLRSIRSDLERERQKLERKAGKLEKKKLKQ